ncbi:MAG: SusC/RagA family TonB-linked outer membrane protein [Candidatus Cyclobacteriaceae bacterium M3_2C_046]
MSRLSLYALSINCVLLGSLLANNVTAQKIKSVKETFIQVHFEDADLKEILWEIQSKTDFQFSYDKKILNKPVKISSTAHTKTVGDLLIQISRQTDLKFKQINNNIHITKKLSKEHKNEDLEIIIQGVKISGKVTSAEDNSGLPGANITIKGTSIGTITDIDGNFSLDVPSENPVLIISSVGYVTEEIQVGNQTFFDIRLNPDVTALDEIVVIGYGTMKKSDLTGAVVSVKSKELEKRVTNTFEQALQGRAAGVQVMVNSGQPGAASTVRIRGTNSLLGTNEPLYVIDGIQVSGNSEGVFFVGNGGNRGAMRVSPLSTINPSDIESIEVLKDASATAIYGNRGANGVIIVTTKKGNKNDSRIEYHVSTGIKNIANKVDVMGLRDYAMFNNEQALSQGKEPRPEFANPASLTGGTDWQDVLFETGTITNHNLSLSGGNEKLTYFVSGSFLDDKGPVANTWMERYTLRANLEVEAKKWLQFGNNFTAGQSNTKYVFADANDSPLTLSLKKAPDVRVYDENGNYVGVEENQTVPGGGLAQANPLALTEDRDSRKRKFNIYNNLFAVLSVSDFKFRSELNLIGDFVNDYAFYAKVEYPGFINSQSLLNQQQSFSIGYEWKNIFYYDKTFGDHTINAMLAHEAREGRWENTRGEGGGFYNNNLNSLDLSDVTYTKTGGNRGRWRQESYLARVFYNYKDLAMVTTSVRSDGSPNFPEGNRWGFFPSFSAALRISNFPFFHSQGLINNLKVNGGWGIVGNDNVLGGQFRPLVNVIPNSDGGFSTSFVNYDPNLSWEETEAFNLGLEIGILDDRFSAQFEVYDKKTRNALNQVLLPSSVGSNIYMVSNIASVQNRGLEITLNSINTTGQFEWRSGVALTVNRNEILDLGEGGLPIYGMASKSEEGGPIGRFYGYQTDGLYQDLDDILTHPRWKGVNSIDPTVGMWIGDYKFVDISDEGTAAWQVPGYTAEYDADGNYIVGSAVYTGNSEDMITINNAGVIDPNDQTYIGNPNPDFTFGFDNTFNWKNFDATIYCVGLVGMDAYNQQKAWLLRADLYNQNQMSIMNSRAIPILRDGGNANDIADYTLTNPDAEVPRIRTDHNFSQASTNSRFIEDASYLRIQNVILGYSFPTDFINRINLSNARIYLNAQNLLTLTKYSGWDPEIGSMAQSSLNSGVDRGRYPVSKIFLLGLQVGF